MKDVTRQRKLALFNSLKTKILTMELRPGDDLDETSLSNEFALSRTPLREVFRQLAGDGYIELRENRGTRVSELSHTSVREFFLVAPMIYSAVLKLAAENRTQAQIEELRETQEEFRTALTNKDGILSTLKNIRFHELTGEMANNSYLLPSFKRLLIDHARIGISFFQPGNKVIEEKQSSAEEQHDQIIEAIVNRDDVRAGKLAELHWQLSRSHIEHFVMPNGMDMSLGTL